jgi:glycosyltransferase involved in cell wall biosynthesis
MHGDRLLLLGPRPHREMPLFLAAADVVAVPQRRSRTTEAQIPGKLFEAMAMGCPILATAVSDLPEILEGCGKVVTPGSVEELGGALDWLLSRPDKAAALGAAARERCVEHYSWDAMERTLEQTLLRWQAR